MENTSIDSPETTNAAVKEVKDNTLAVAVATDTRELDMSKAKPLTTTTIGKGGEGGAVAGEGANGVKGDKYPDFNKKNDIDTSTMEIDSTIGASTIVKKSTTEDTHPDGQNGTADQKGVTHMEYDDPQKLQHQSDKYGCISDSIIEKALYRITAGLPKRELRSIIQETTECEVSLLNDIKVLEAALLQLQQQQKQQSSSSTSPPSPSSSMPAVESVKDSHSATGQTMKDVNESLHTIMEASLSIPYTTPIDRYYTTSALVGRLRNELAMPSVVHVQNQIQQQRSDEQLEAIAKNIQPLSNTTIDEVNTFEELTTPSTNKSKSIVHTIYTNEIVSQDILLNIWKKISTNRVAFVFKRAVKIEEAPGYTDRILYPMDLSLIRKRIITNNIRTYADLHNALALISHNCVKYNGRETDYGRVARDFEAFVDHVIVQAVRQHSVTTTGTTTAASIAVADTSVSMVAGDTSNTSTNITAVNTINET